MLNRLLDMMNPDTAGGNEVNIYEHLCLNTRSGKKLCQACEIACPVSSIKLSATKIEIQDCIKCGLCAVACPTGVFDRLWDAFSRVVNMGKEQRPACVIKCHKTEPLVGAIVINCLGELTAELVFHIIQRGTGKITVFYQPEACADCECSTGRWLWEDTRKKLARIYPEASGIFIENNDPLCCDLSSSQEINYSRRSLLRNLTVDARQMMRDLVIGRENQGGMQDRFAQSLSLRRRLLIKMLNTMGPEAKEKIEPGYLRHPEIIDGCTFCGSCAVLCPSGAMKFMEQKDGTVSLSNTPAECNMCGLCAAVCPEKAINIEVDGQISSAGAVILQNGTIRRCMRCGSEYYDKSEANPPLCRDCGRSKFKPDELWFMQ